MSGLGGGRQALSEAEPDRSMSAGDLIAGAVDTTVGEPEIYLPPELLADLYDPGLIISPRYVGLDRRSSGGRSTGSPFRGVHLRGRSLRLLEVVLVALATVAAVVPLTLIASHAPVQASSHQQARKLAAARPAFAARPPPGGPPPPAARPARHYPARLTRHQAPRAAGPSIADGKPDAGVTASTSACDEVGDSVPTPRCAHRPAVSERRAQHIARRAARIELRQLASTAVVADSGS